MSKNQQITRRRQGKSFSYYLDGKPIKDTSKLERIRSLSIPPAWNDVTIATSSRSDIQATGKDEAGRQ